MKESQYNQVLSVYGHPNVLGTFVRKTIELKLYEDIIAVWESRETQKCTGGQKAEFLNITEWGRYRV
jgi:hypothetical protein